jgi:hypothetical protein
MHLTHVFLLIVSVLLCPLRCSGAVLGRACIKLSQPQACGCCGHTQERSAPAAPASQPQQPPAPGDDCGNCLCHGAMTGPVADNHLLTVECSYLLPPVEAGAVRSGGESGAAHRQRACHFPLTATGRDVCALTCTRTL